MTAGWHAQVLADLDKKLAPKASQDALAAAQQEIDELRKSIASAHEKVAAEDGERRKADDDLNAKIKMGQDKACHREACVTHGSTMHGGGQRKAWRRAAEGMAAAG